QLRLLRPRAGSGALRESPACSARETYQDGGQCMLLVKVEVDERLASEDLEVSTSRLVVRLRLRSKWLSVMLPCRVRADAAGPVRLSKLGRSLRISLPMD
ncbi:unnamed protein product, partial [Polarella glacialis]